MGASATRRGGETYAGRTLVFEDCRRDVKLELGRAVLDRAGPALALVLDSARWYSHAIATRYRVALRRVFDELAAEHDEVVPYVRFHERVVPLFAGEIVGEIVRDLVADGPTAQVLAGSPAFAPQVAKVLAHDGADWLTVDQVALAVTA